MTTVRPRLIVPASAPTRRERPAFTLAVAVFFLLAFVLPMLTVQFGNILGDPTNVALAYLITVYSAFGIAQLVYSGGARIVRLAAFIFFYVFMGVSVLAQVAANQFPLNLSGTGDYNAVEIRRALVIVIFGIAAFEVAFVAANAFRRRKRPDADTPTESVRPARTRRFNEVRVLILAVIGIGFAALAISRTGIGPFFDSRQAAGNAVLGNTTNSVVFNSATKSSRALFKALAQVPLLVSLFAILYMRRHKLWRPGSQLMQLTTSVIFLMLIAFNLILNNPIANSRFWFSTVAITLLSVYVPLTKARGVRWAAILSILVLLFAFTSLQAFRRTGGAREYSSGFQDDLLTSGTYSAFTMEMVGQRWLRDHPHTEGRQLLGAALIFVPRGVWHGKPVDTGNLVLPLVNPAASLWTEGDVEAGFFGAFGYFVVLGAAASVLDRRFRAARPGSVSHAVIPICAGFTIFLLRGSLSAAFGPAYMLIAGVWFISRRSTPTEPASNERAPLA